MKILIVGSRGLLGSEILRFFSSQKVDIITADLPEYNVVSYVNMKKLFKEPIDFCFNCAAYTNVPLAEDDYQKAYFVNSQGVGVLTKLCIESKTHLIHFSTDFVFDGKSEIPYKEDDPTNPLNCYGKTKLDGEKILVTKMKKFKRDHYTIFRLQWLYGLTRDNFFTKILERAKNNEALMAPSDELGSPMSVSFLAEILYLCVSYKKFKKFSGEIFHLTHDDSCSRYDCALYFFECLNMPVSIKPLTNIKSNVERPKYGVLSNEKLRNVLKMGLGSWKKHLKRYAEDLKCSIE